MKIRRHSIIYGLCFLLSTSVFAFEHAGGGYHGGPVNGGYHNGYYNGGYYGDHGYYNGYHNNGWYGGSVNVNSWDEGIWYDDNLNDDTSVVIGVPDQGYYDPSCQTIDDCSTGTCVLSNSCE